MEIGSDCDQDEGPKGATIGRLRDRLATKGTTTALEHHQMIDHDKLSELANTLTEDQRRLLREGLAGGAAVDPATLTASLKRLDSDLLFLKHATEGRDFDKAKERVRPLGPEVVTPDPPLTRW
jgi:hypothetical protein